MGLSDAQELNSALREAVYNAVAGWVSRHNETDTTIFNRMVREGRLYGPERRIAEFDWAYRGNDGDPSDTLVVTTTWDKELRVTFPTVREER